MKLEQQSPAENTDHPVHIYDPTTGLDDHIARQPTVDPESVFIYIPDNGRSVL